MVNRFEPVALPRWEMNRDFQMLLASFERILPLRQPSLLAEPALATKLLALSEGTIGELFALLVAATVRAIRSGAERIDEGVLGSIDWIAPSARRRAIEKLTRFLSIAPSLPVCLRLAAICARQAVVALGRSQQFWLVARIIVPSRSD